MADTQMADSDRIAALEKEVCELRKITKRLIIAVIDTAQNTGYRVRHVKLAREALQHGFLEYRDVE